MTEFDNYILALEQLSKAQQDFEVFAKNNTDQYNIAMNNKDYIRSEFLQDEIKKERVKLHYYMNLTVRAYDLYKKSQTER